MTGAKVRPALVLTSDYRSLAWRKFDGSTHRLMDWLLYASLLLYAIIVCHL